SERQNREQRSLQRRLRLVESLRAAGFSEPHDLARRFVLECFPVLPPGLRPLSKSLFCRRSRPSSCPLSSGLNDHYLRILNQSPRMARCVEFNAPPVILQSVRSMLQTAVDGLIENETLDRPVRRRGGLVESLSSRLRGERSRFRLYLLSKRVDY